MIQKNLFTKQKQNHRLRKPTYGYQRGKVGGRYKLGVWDKHIQTTTYKIHNQQGQQVLSRVPCIAQGTLLNAL